MEIGRLMNDRRTMKLEIWRCLASDLRLVSAASIVVILRPAFLVWLWTFEFKIPSWAFTTLCRLEKLDWLVKWKQPIR